MLLLTFSAVWVLLIVAASGCCCWQTVCCVAWSPRYEALLAFTYCYSTNILWCRDLAKPLYLDVQVAGSEHTHNTHTRTRTHTYTHTLSHTNTHTHAHTHRHTHTFTHTHAHTHAVQSQDLLSVRLTLGPLAQRGYLWGGAAAAAAAAPGQSKTEGTPFDVTASFSHDHTQQHDPHTPHSDQQQLSHTEQRQVLAARVLRERMAPDARRAVLECVHFPDARTAAANDEGFGVIVGGRCGVGVGGGGLVGGDVGHWAEQQQKLQQQQSTGGPQPLLPSALCRSQHLRGTPGVNRREGWVFLFLLFSSVCD